MGGFRLCRVRRTLGKVPFSPQPRPVRPPTTPGNFEPADEGMPPRCKFRLSRDLQTGND
jgi:hypothetical protein